MNPGIFAKTFQRATLPEVLDTVRSFGFTEIQFNMSCAGLPSLPDELSQATARRIGQELQQRGIRMSAVSGTFNMIHPDPLEREKGLTSLGVLAAACQDMGTSVITLCTGTLDAGSMWAYHPGNASPEAWRALTAALEQALLLAEQHNVQLAIEPEPANVVASAPLARRLLDEMQSPRLKIIMDAANLYPAGRPQELSAVLEEAFHLLGHDIILAHAKDVLDEAGTRFGAAGQGLIHYEHYIELLLRYGYQGPLIMHGLEERDVPGSSDFLNRKLAAVQNKT
ncbi:sugar phosphate isomerase/epimerase family protein [Paenibacillus sp. NPDC056722]|uniref:sugar phosphate isomerase/epimerase family protein n=1 Tax=Paenibacillus sp. NPDC056722 TaxID=3345924 RepID=UPI0036B71B2B